MLDRQLRVKSVNRAFYETFRLTRAETKQRTLDELRQWQWQIAQLHPFLEDLISEGRAFDNGPPGAETSPPRATLVYW